MYHVADIDKRLHANQLAPVIPLELWAHSVLTASCTANWAK